MELYLVRHTAPDVMPGICYGRSELDVCAGFAHELAAIQTKLDGITPAALYSSPQLRCLRLAQAMGLGQPILDDRLMELHFGNWELQAWEEIPRDELDRWASNYVDHTPPGGESFRALHRRVTEFINEIKKMPCAAPVVIVTHAGVIRAMLAEVLQLPLTEAFRFQLAFGGVTQLLLQPQCSIGYVNR
jgi:alpha-ribazole phosphatase